MNFDCKSSNSDDKDQSRGDPLLELTRLFGSRPEEGALRNDGRADYDREAEFPPGEFRVFEAACSSQSSFDDNQSYTLAQPVQERETVFFGSAAGEEYDGQLVEDDFQADGYYGDGYDDADSLVYQEAQKGSHYGDMSAGISGDEDRFSIKNEWYDAGHSYAGVTNYPADETGYPVAGYEEGDVCSRSPEQESEHYQKTSHDNAGRHEDWPHGVPVQEMGIPSSLQAAYVYDDHDEIQHVSGGYFPGESGLEYKKESAVFSCLPEQPSDGQEEQPVYLAVHAGNAGQQPEQIWPVGSEIHAVAPNSGRRSFDDVFGEADLPQETAFESPDYEAVYNDVVASAEKDGPAELGDVWGNYGKADSHFYPDEDSAVFSRDAVEYSAEPPVKNEVASQLAEASLSQTYFGQIGHGYSYVVQPVMQGHSNYRKGFSYQNASLEQDIAVHDGCSEGAEAFVADGDNGARSDQAHCQQATEVLHDFDMKNCFDRIAQRRQAAELGPLELSEPGIEETEAFDLPPVDYEHGTARVRIDSAIDQEFADIFGVDGQADYVPAEERTFQNIEEEEFFSLSGDASDGRDDVPPEKLPDDEREETNTVYDWASPAVLSAAVPSDAGEGAGGNGHKWLYGAVAAFIALGAGAYMFFHLGSMKNGVPVVHAEEGEIKRRPENAKQSLKADQEKAVYNHVEGNPSEKAEQETLIDKTEIPLDIHKVDEQLPLSTKSGLDHSSVESFVRTAALRSMPIHIVPTVVVSSDRKIVTVSQPDQKEAVFISGDSMDVGNNDAEMARTESAGAQKAAGAEVIVLDGSQHPAKNR